MNKHCFIGISRNEIEEMIDRQYDLNVQTNGEDWFSGIAQNGKQIAWDRCAIQEVSELIDSYPWKHWKFGDEPDILNAQIELVDIWHFLLSEFMSFTMESFKLNSPNLSYSQLWRVARQSTISDLYDILTDSQLENDVACFCEQALERVKKVTEHKHIYQIALFDALIDAISAHRVTMQNIKRNAVDKSCYKFYLFQSKDSIKSVMVAFMGASTELNFSLPKVYYGKNILNSFRQKHGYKDGTYKKHWQYNNSVLEDNKVMVDLLNSGILLDELYKEMEKIYVRQFS